MDPNIGRRFGNRYAVADVVGVGGMAIVYRATDTALGREVAVKVLKQEFASDPDIRRRFSMESRAVAKLSQGNIVSVFDVGTEGDTDYIVMELIEGITLKEYLKQKGALSWREALYFAEQIARALEHAHSRGIIHQDVKPQNVLLLRDGTAKLTDFGIASFAAQQETRVVQEAIGSVHYISPEQAKGIKIDYRTDLYSLGVVMYEMLTGSLPFDGDTAIQVVMQHMNGTNITPSKLVAGIPVGFDEIVMHAMCVDPVRRYPSAQALLADLERLRQDEQTCFVYDPPEADEPTRVLEERVVEVARQTSKAAARPSYPAPASRDVAIPNEREGFFEKLGEHPGLAVATAVALFVIIAGIVAAVLLLRNGTNTARISMPQLVGLDINVVLEDETLNEQFTLRERVPRVESDKPVGQIVAQSVEENKQVARGTIVDLTVSGGSEQSDTGYTIPDFTGKKLDYVTTVLDEHEIGYRIRREYHEEYLEDELIRTEPAAGQTLSSGMLLTLWVSRGSEMASRAEIPNLTGLTETRARQALEDRGLSVGSITWAESEASEGTVIWQSVDAGKMVDKGTSVGFQLSSGKAEEQQTPTVVDEPVQPTVPDTPAVSTPEPESPQPEAPVAPVQPTMGQAAVQVVLPPSTDLAHVVISVDGEVQHDNTYTTTQGTVTILLHAAVGEHQVTVSIDGNANTTSYTFE